jgi:outer membrane protein OmpA-like peptidoglycan-associated protein
MKVSRSVSWSTALIVCALGGAATAGCCNAKKPEAPVKAPEPPPPPPPPPDTDGDGIIDPEDKCPTVPEDGNPPDPKDGCPNLDMDGDNILIPQDKCPDQPETVNGFEDDDGCPDTKPIAQLTETSVEISQKIQFKKGSAAIEPESQVVIDAVADVLNTHPEVELVVVEGHASKEGSAFFNKNLTQQRVDSVVKGLGAKGVAKERLVSQGFGFYCPLDPGDTPEALEMNRRVEFKIVYRKGQKLETPLGCAEAEAKGVKVKLPATPPKSAAPAAAPAPAAPAPAPAAPATPPPAAPAPAPAPAAPKQ